MLGIPQQNAKKDFPKVVKQTEALPNGMYKAIFCGFVTLGFHEDDFNEGKLKFYSNFIFEAVEDMAGNKVGNFVKEFDDGSKEEGPTCFFKEIAITDSLHHKSNGFAIAKALDPNVPVVSRGKENEHQYIDGFDWEKALGTSVLLQISQKKSKASGRLYNKVESVMPLGMPLEGTKENIFFNLYNQDHKEVFEKLDGFTKKKIRDSKRVPQEPEVIYRGEEADEAPQVPDPEPDAPQPKVDFDDDVPF